MRSDFQCERQTMLCEASVLVKRAAEPRVIGDSVKAAIARAANKLRWRYSRTKDIWYARARRIDAHEMDALRKEAAKQAAKYERIANAMVTTDPEFFGEDIAALVHTARALRRSVGEVRGVGVPGESED